MIGRSRCCCLNQSQVDQPTEGLANINGYITIYNSIFDQTTQAVGYRIHIYRVDDDSWTPTISVVYPSQNNEPNYLIENLSVNTNDMYYLKIINKGQEVAQTDSFQLIPGQTKTVDYQIVVN